MNVVGNTEDGRSIVDGVFFLQTSIGLPLDIIVEELRDKNCVPVWDVYIIDALDGGWFGPTIFNALMQQDLPEDTVKQMMVKILNEYEYDD
jgi:hypothetical protein